MSDSTEETADDLVYMSAADFVGWTPPSNVSLRTRYWLIQFAKELEHKRTVKPERTLMRLEDLERREIEYAIAIKEEKGLTFEDIAEELGISEKNLWNKRKQYGLV